MIVKTIEQINTVQLPVNHQMPTRKNQPLLLVRKQTIGSAELVSAITQAVDDIRPPVPLRWLVNE
jgi:hypothetical protein